MSDFELGQRVRYQHKLHRRPKFWGVDNVQFDKFWTIEDRFHVPTEGGEGIIIGKRTLSNGNTRYGYDEGATYEGKEYFQAYLVAFDLRKKPVHVLPEHIESIA